MELETDDKNDGPIQYSEDFRRAKRNALTWAGIVILLSIGTIRGEPGDTSPEVIEIGSVARNLAYSQSVLIVLAAAALIFMLVGFYRSERRLARFHAKFALHVKLKAVGALADTLVIHLQQANEGFESFKTLIEEEKSRLTPHEPSLKQELTNILKINVDSLAAQIAQGYDDLEKGKPKPQIAEYKAVVRRTLAEHYNGAAANLTMTVDQAMQRSNSALQAATEKEAGWGNDLKRRIENAASLSERLTRFSADLIGGEKRWHFWFEIVPVGLTGAVALTAGGLRLAAPDVIEGWIAPEAHQSSPGTQLSPPSATPASPAPNPAA